MVVRLFGIMSSSCFELQGVVIVGAHDIFLKFIAFEI